MRPAPDSGPRLVPRTENQGIRTDEGVFGRAFLDDSANVLAKEGRTMNAVKQAVLELAKALPDECTWDDVMYRIYVRQKIEAGLNDAEEGRLFSHEEVFKEFQQ